MQLSAGDDKRSNVKSQNKAGQRMTVVTSCSCANSKSAADGKKRNHDDYGKNCSFESEDSDLFVKVDKLF